jgi:hypothetical protein
LLVIAVLAITNAGCMGATLIDERADDDISLVKWRTRRLTFSRVCKGGGFGSDCGLVTDLVASRTFREKFAEKRCADIGDEVCAVELGYAAKLWIADRYFAAESHEIQRACGSCTFREYELRLLASHNTRLYTLSGKEIEAINDRRASEQRRFTLDTMGTLNALAGAVGRFGR